MINHIDEHNTGILDFPAFYNLVKKKSCDQVNGKCCKTLKSTVSRTQKITSRMHSGLSARTQEVRVLNANLRVHIIFALWTTFELSPFLQTNSK